MPRPQSVVRAFTLIEILVMVSIMGLCAAVIIPQLGTRSDLLASSAARQVMSDLTYAQNQAITRQQPVYVVFTPAATASPGGSYSVMSGLPSTVMNHPVNKFPWVTTFGQSRGQFSNVRLDSASFDGSAAIMFDESGAPFMISPVGGASAPLNTGSVSVSCGAFTLRVTVEPLTGALSVQ